MQTPKYFVNDAAVRQGAPLRHLSLKERRSQELLRQRRARQAQTIADMRAPRVWLEMFNQIARDLDAEEYVDGLFEKFAGLNPELLRALGADQISHLPLRAVGGPR
jgi:hypothetical protein